jgi:putative ABC transport system substrate-binding protein
MTQSGHRQPFQYADLSRYDAFRSWGTSMKRREFIAVLGGAAAWPFAAHAQQKSASIGFLVAGAAGTSAALIEAFKQGLRENGLIEGKDFVLDLRWAEGHYERFPAFARELADTPILNLQ